MILTEILLFGGIGLLVAFVGVPLLAGLMGVTVTIFKLPSIVIDARREVREQMIIEAAEREVLNEAAEAEMVYTTFKKENE